MTTATLQIPELINATTQTALKTAADSIAMEIAKSDAAKDSDWEAVLCLTNDQRAERVKQINALLNAAATLQGIAHRDWAEVSILDAAAQIEWVAARSTTEE